jgi:hypothetical protein
MIEVKKISKNIYKVDCGTNIPYYIQIDGEYIRIIQPPEKSLINPEESFGKLFPQELIIALGNFSEFASALHKLIILERLDKTNDEYEEIT